MAQTQPYNYLSLDGFLPLLGQKLLAAVQRRQRPLGISAAAAAAWRWQRQRSSGGGSMAVAAVAEAQQHDSGGSALAAAWRWQCSGGSLAAAVANISLFLMKVDCIDSYFINM